MHDQITVVVGVDAKTLPQLHVSHRTWKMHRPEMYDRMPWVVFYDGDNLSIEHGVRRMMDEGGIPAHAEVVAWPQCLGLAKKIKYESQREKMLTGHVWVPALAVKTFWSMKIDTDVVALEPSKWLDEAWFDDMCDPADGECDVDCEVRYVAPGWNYTKGINFLGILEEWGDKVDWGPWGEHPRLNIPFDPTHLRVPHKRMCSWVSYYNVSMLQWLCRELEKTVGRGKLPVPSQDTTVWYACERADGGDFYRIVNQKHLRWTNCPKMHTLVETVRKVMMGEGAITDG